MNIKNAAVYGASVRTRAAARHQSVITHHTSTCRTDTFTLTEPLSFTWRGREMESKGRDIKKLPRFFFLFSSFHCCLSNLSIPPTPNHQPSGLACHCWVSLFSFRGAPDLFFSLFLSSLGESAISSEHAGVTSRLTSLYGWGQGQVSSQDSPEGRGPGLAMPCGPHALISLSACLHLWPPPSGPRDSGGQQPICEDTWLSTGGEISFTRAPVIWTVTNEASLVTSTDEQPQAGFFGGPLLHC